MDGANPARVLIVGGGVGAIEAALALRSLAGERTAVEICAARPDFVYRPFAVGEPYGASRVIRYDLERLAERCGADFRHENIAAIDTASRCASSHDGTEIPYDYLVVACGARLLWAVPGATPFWGVADAGEVQAVVDRRREGRLR
ncbi:MAG TPA: FAD-dependent oxidoreductase, partial [Solirubrobacterales bacterium]